MRSYERSGLQVDQCTECRGIFLDRGELERLVDAEGAYYERGGGRREGRDDDDRDYRDRDHDDRDHRGYDDDDREHRGGSLSQMGGLGGLLGDRDKHRGGHRKKHKRESFLSDLFD
jgi:uncharacterized protein